jgi:hypothetical protein
MLFAPPRTSPANWLHSVERVSGDVQPGSAWSVADSARSYRLPVPPGGSREGERLLRLDSTFADRGPLTSRLSAEDVKR